MCAVQYASLIDAQKSCQLHQVPLLLLLMLLLLLLLLFDGRGIKDQDIFFLHLVPHRQAALSWLPCVDPSTRAKEKDGTARPCNSVIALSFISKSLKAKYNNKNEDDDNRDSDV